MANNNFAQMHVENASSPSQRPPAFLHVQQKDERVRPARAPDAEPQALQRRRAPGQAAAMEAARRRRAPQQGVPGRGTEAGLGLHRDRSLSQGQEGNQRRRRLVLRPRARREMACGVLWNI